MVIADPTKIMGVKEYEGVEVDVGPTCHEPGCKGYGAIDSEVMFIGIAPGRDEVKSGRPLTGPSGKMFNSILKGIGLDRRSMYCTNLICWYKDDPTPEEAKKCSGRLDEEIRQRKPKLIVLLGKIVAEIFTGREFAKVRGAVQWNDEYQCYVLVTNHPAAILHGMYDKDDKAVNAIYDVVRDFRKIQTILDWEPGAPFAEVSYRVVSEIGEAQRVLDNLPKGGEPVALDVETTYSRLDEEVEVFKDKNEIRCLGVGTKDFVWVLTPDALYRKDGAPALHWPLDVCWTMQNAIFDSQVIRLKLGFWIPIVEDTMLQSYSLDERGGKDGVKIHGLKQLSREYLAAPFYEEGKNKTIENLYRYNAHDVAYTARLCHLFRERQEEDNVRGFYLRLLIPALNMYNRIQFRGARIDKLLHKKLAIEWIKRFTIEEEALMDEAEQLGWQGRLNINSPDQLSKFLFGVLGLPIIKRTKKGKPSIDKEVIEALKNQHEFISKLEGIRHLSKMISVYITGFAESEGPKYYDNDSWMVAHSVVRLHGTVTGRPAYSNLPLQLIPAAFMPIYGVLRNLFIPMNPDTHVIIEADFGKAEIWAGYAYSEDSQLYADLTSGDFHSNTGVTVLGKPLNEITKQDRTDMKRVTFGIMYYIEENSLGKLIKRSSKEAKRFIENWYARYQGYYKWFQKILEETKTNGELVSKTGRKRRLIILGNNVVRVLKQAVNFPIQSTSSDVLLASAIDLYPKLEEIDAHILFTVHDSIVIEAPKDNLNEAIRRVHDSMTNKWFDGMPPLPVEIKVGPNWGECKEVHDCSKTVHQQLTEGEDKGFPIKTAQERYNITPFGMCLWGENDS